MEKEEQSQKRQVDKGQTLIKKLIKKFIVQDEEAGEPVKSSNLEYENIVLGQSINVDESRVSKLEMKEVDPVEDVLPTESNQGVKEDVKEQK